MTNLEESSLHLGHSLTSLREYIHEYPRDMRASELKLKMIDLQNRLEELIKDRGHIPDPPEWPNPITMDGNLR